jgi:hypothetical protein
MDITRNMRVAPVNFKTHELICDIHVDHIIFLFVKSLHIHEFLARQCQCPKCMRNANIHVNFTQAAPELAFQSTR